MWTDTQRLFGALGWEAIAGDALSDGGGFKRRVAPAVRAPLKPGGIAVSAGWWAVDAGRVAMAREGGYPLATLPKEYQRFLKREKCF